MITMINGNHVNGHYYDYHLQIVICNNQRDCQQKKHQSQE